LSTENSFEGSARRCIVVADDVDMQRLIQQIREHRNEVVGWAIKWTESSCCLW